MKYLTYEEMEKLTTERLLAYKKKHLSSERCPFYRSHKCHDNGCTVCSSLQLKLEQSLAYKNIKEILSTREHIQ